MNVTEWQPIETAPRGEVILFFPVDTSGKMWLGKMVKVGRVGDFPYRQPTHWMPIPKLPTETSHDAAR
jgi:hypothetical protein